MEPVSCSRTGTRERVRIADDRLARSLVGLLPVLESLFPIAWAGNTAAREGPVLATLGVASDASGASDPGPVAEAPSPCLLVPAPDAGRPVKRLEAVSFADAAPVPRPFRGRSLEVPVEVDVAVHRTLAGRAGTVLMRASCGAPIWIVDGTPTRPVHRTSLRLPSVQAGSDAGLSAGGERFLQALPLFHLLRQALGGGAPVDPPLRAGFIIDDPNLHWPTYGHADYGRIAASAERDRYHVAFATVPFDAWWVHAPTAAIFRSHPRQLSLLVHGNNHGREELTRDASDAACAATLRQALVRIEGLERRAGLRVARVMVPPHGACSSRMLAALPRHGFEAACISAGSLRAHNADRPWSRTLGFAPAETTDGCPVLLRWPLAGTRLVTLLVAAYLGQPLILRGHHQDLKDGHDALRAWAHAINGIGPVQWGSPAELARLAVSGRSTDATPAETSAPPSRVGPFEAADRTPPVSASAVRTALVARRLLTETRDRLRLNGAVRTLLLGG